MTELGSIERPPVDNYAGKRKLYCVPNIYLFPDAPQEFRDLLAVFWREVATQLDKIEIAGKAKKIFVEHLNPGKAGEDELARHNAAAAKLVSARKEEGAELIAFEDPEILGDYIDWSSCLQVVMTKKIFEKIYEFFTGATERRLTHLAGVIDRSLLPGEAGLLIMNEADRSKIQFPKDIEVFLVAPRSYDDILRWMRERNKPKNHASHDKGA